MSNKLIFKRYIEIAEMLGKMFPGVLEVIVHDFSDLDRSIIFVVNGHISGRQVGEGATELGLRRLLENEEIPDLLVNYLNRDVLGRRLKSASMAIRDDREKMIGALCLNFDTTPFEHIQHVLEGLTQCDVHALVGEGELVPLVSLEEEIHQHIQNYLSQHHLQASQLTYADKQKIVSYLEQKGCFRQKGAMTAIAKALQLTRQSIYNYFKKDKKNDSKFF